MQEQAYIVIYSGGTMPRNFTLGQTMYNYDYFKPRDDDRREWRPRALDAVADEVAAGDAAARGRGPTAGRTAAHLRERRAHDAGRPVPARPLHRLERTFALVLGNEVTTTALAGLRAHGRIQKPRLTQPQIQQNFEAGVASASILLSRLALVNVPASYVMFEGRQFDSYSYLFNSRLHQPRRQPGP